MTMIKKLEELNISPTPWRVYQPDETEYEIRHAEDDKPVGYVVPVSYVSVQYSKHEPDAKMLAAAPEMYEALWQQCFGDIPVVNCRKCLGCNNLNYEECSRCHLGKAKAALVKASGADDKVDAEAGND